MKKSVLIFTILLVVAALGACRHEEEILPARLVLGFGGRSATSKSFAPSEIAVSSIKVEGLGPGGEKVAAECADYAPVELELSPGSWLITARGLNGQGLEVASGFLELSLSPSERVARDIFLAPAAGEGSVSLAWTLSGTVDGVLSLEGSLGGADAQVLPIAAPFGGGPLRFEGLRNGAWTLELRLLKDGAPLCGLADGILVAAGMETKLSVCFKPPIAALSLGFVLPDYSGLGLQIEPSIRRVSRGTQVAFRAPTSGKLAWYEEGRALPAAGGEIRYAPSTAAASLRVDCVTLGSALPRSGSAQLRFAEGQALGPLAFGELVGQEAGSAAAQAAMRALGDCRDLAWSADGARLAVAGKSSNALSLFEAPAPGAVFARGGLGGAAEPRLLSPSLVRFLPGGSRLLALSEPEGAAYSISVDAAGNMAFTGRLAEPCLAGAKDAVVSANASCAYVAASGADAVALLSLGGGGELLGAAPAAAKGGAGLASFSRPFCLALSPAGDSLAVGTAGDDAIYLFDRDVATDALAFRARMDKSAFPGDGPLSDPCSLAFSPGGASLFVLSYYGKALIRLDRDPGTGLFAPVASARSGTLGVAGFAYPKRLALSPDGSLLAVVGGGAEDGLALFEVGTAAQLAYVGSMLPGAGPAVPARPSAAAFSPDGRVLAVCADGYLSFFAR